jgi:hypothetical protein
LQGQGQKRDQGDTGHQGGGLDLVEDYVSPGNVESIEHRQPNPKHEARNPKQIRNSNVLMFKTLVTQQIE